MGEDYYFIPPKSFVNLSLKLLKSNREQVHRDKLLLVSSTVFKMILGLAGDEERQLLPPDN